MAIVIQGKVLVAGEASGTALVSAEPLSFWGGYNQTSGEIIDRRHSLSGEIGAGRILVIPFTRGSSTTTAVLLEAIKAHTAPAGIITREADSFLALASIVADEMYDMPIPIISLPGEDFERLQTDMPVQIRVTGEVIIAE